MNERQLHLSKTCYFEAFDYISGDETKIDVSLNYVERSPDPWYGDSYESIDISKDEAIELIEFLKNSFNI